MGVDVWAGAVALALLLGAAPAKAACTRGPLDVAATIQFVLPSSAAIQIQDRNGRTRVATAGDCLGPDEALILSPAVRRAEVFDGQRFVPLTPHDAPFRSRSAVAQAAVGAATVIERVYRWAPRRSGSLDGADTAVRGSEGAPAANPIVPSGPPQWVAPELTGGQVATAWFDGQGPFRCGSGGRETLLPSSPDGGQECLITIGRDGEVLRIRDAAGRELAWPLRQVRVRDVPRPSWLPASAMTDSDRLAWGLWLLQDGTHDGRWALQGYSLVAAAQGSSWAAGDLHGRLRSGEIGPSELRGDR